MITTAAAYRITLGIVLATTYAEVASAPVMPPQGGAAIYLERPVWLSGISNDAIVSDAGQLPAPERTEHFVVVNAGYWLVNQDKPSQVVYEFALTVTKPFERRVFTRIRLDNPEDASSPITYEHYLDPAQKSTKVTHGPLKQVRANAQYTLMLEIFADESRSVLLERVAQKIVSPLDNASGCVQLHPSIMKALFYVKKNIPLEKLSLACDK